MFLIQRRLVYDLLTEQPSYLSFRSLSRNPFLSLIVAQAYLLVSGEIPFFWLGNRFLLFQMLTGFHKRLLA